MACDVSLEAMFFPFLVALLYTPATKSLLLANPVFFCSFYSFFFSSVLSLLCTTDGLVLELKYSPFFNCFQRSNSGSGLPAVASNDELADKFELSVRCW